MKYSFARLIIKTEFTFYAGEDYLQHLYSLSYIYKNYSLIYCHEY